MPRLPNGLNPRQQAFVLAYLVHFNATQAAIEAGYSKKTARFQASELLTNPNIEKALEQAQVKRNAKHEGLAERVIAEAERLAFMDDSDDGEWSFARVTAKQKALDWLAKHLGLWKQPDAPPTGAGTTVNVLVSNEDAARIIGSLVGRAQLTNGNGNGDGDAH